jgi:hypothetical protein
MLCTMQVSDEILNGTMFKRWRKWRDDI